jgi:hypothetical protein
MVTMRAMKKQEAIDLLGGTPMRAAKNLGVTVQCIYKWPDELPEAISDRVVGAIVRLAAKGIPKTKTVVTTVEEA